MVSRFRLGGPSPIHFKHLLFITCGLLVMASSTRGDVVFYESESAWQANAVGDIQALDLFNAIEIVLANEVSSPPSDGDLLGTSVLTFESASTGFGQDFQLNLLESLEFPFSNGGHAGRT